MVFCITRIRGFLDLFVHAYEYYINIIVSQAAEKVQAVVKAQQRDHYFNVNTNRAVLNHVRMDLLGMWAWLNLGRSSTSINSCESTVQFGSNEWNKDMENH